MFFFSFSWRTFFWDGERWGECLGRVLRLGRFNLQYRKEGVEESTEGDEDAAPGSRPVVGWFVEVGLWLACGKSQ